MIVLYVYKNTKVKFLITVAKMINKLFVIIVGVLTKIKFKIINKYNAISVLLKKKIKKIKIFLIMTIKNNFNLAMFLVLFQMIGIAFNVV